MINFEKLQRVRRELRNADDEALIALCSTGNVNKPIENTIHHLREAASLLGFVLAMKDDGK